MKITSAEVKTMYALEISYLDFANIFIAAENSISRLDSEFADFDLKNRTIGNIRHCFETLHKAEDIQYIVRKLGFDGVSNYGYYNDRKDVYRMTAYNHGDTLNDK